MKMNIISEIIGLLGIQAERIDGEDDFLFQYVLNVKTHFLSFLNEYKEELTAGIETKAMLEKEQDLLNELEGVIVSFNKEDEICAQLAKIKIKIENKSKDEEIEL